MAYTPIGWQDLPSEETPISADNLNHMDEQIKANADALVPASTDNIGLVKPDGDTITVDEDGTIHSIGGGGGDVPDNIVLYKDESTPSTPAPRDADTLGGQLPSYYATKDSLDNKIIREKITCETRTFEPNSTYTYTTNIRKEGYSVLTVVPMVWHGALFSMLFQFNNSVAYFGVRNFENYAVENTPSVDVVYIKN